MGTHTCQTGPQIASPAQTQVRPLCLAVCWLLPAALSVQEKVQAKPTLYVHEHCHVQPCRCSRYARVPTGIYNRLTPVQSSSSAAPKGRPWGRGIRSCITPRLCCSLAPRGLQAPKIVTHKTQTLPHACGLLPIPQGRKGARPGRGAAFTLHPLRLTAAPTRDAMCVRPIPHPSGFHAQTTRILYFPAQSCPCNSLLASRLRL